VSIFCCAKFCDKNLTTPKINLHFSSWGSESEINILKPILADFEKENPQIKIDFMHIPQNYFQKIHLLFASNTAPDVIFINNQYLPIYANAGVLEDLSDYNFEFDKFYDKSIETLKSCNLL
jgi:multiple sugar transport system substrate-binding protein